MELTIREALAFDDVLLEPAYSEVLPGDVLTSGRFSRRIPLNVPLVSAAMDTVTEHQMAIAMAQAGGIGVIHKNLSPDEQAEEVRRVKRYETGMVVNPVTMFSDQTLATARSLMDAHNISGIPVIDPITKRLVGVVTNRDVRFAVDPQTPITELMTRDPVAVKGAISTGDAQEILHRNRIEKLMVVDDDGICIGLITVKDINKAKANPLGNKDSHGRLRVAAAVGTGADTLDRLHALAAAGVDAIVIDTAHGHSRSVLDTVHLAKNLFPHIDIVAGNVATPAAAEALIMRGADAVKIGIGPGSICTTRIVAGVGVPQLSAILETAALCGEHDIPAIADGGIRASGDVVKALAAGASCVMLGSMLAGTDETPGEVFLYQGRSYKGYRGMGSLGAMAQGSADRYGQSNVRLSKMVPEGVEAKVPARGPVGLVLHQIVGGLRSGMGYLGAEDLDALQRKATFRRITGAGLRESHVHDVQVTKSAPNYNQE